MGARSKQSSADNLRNARGGGKDDDGQDIWQRLMAASSAAGQGNPSAGKPDTVVYFVGNSGVGKTTLRNWFMSSDASPAASVAYAVSSPPKPTMGLDYTFVRRSNAIDWKEVVHIWEVAGGQQLVGKTVESKHLFLPLTHITSAVFVVAVDLSKQPGEAIRELLWWLKSIARSEARCCDTLTHQGSQLPAQLLARAKARFGNDHEDVDAVNLSRLPIVIVGTKYDKFLCSGEDADDNAESLKILARTLRYIAHTYGASLIYTSFPHSTVGQPDIDHIEKKRLEEMAQHQYAALKLILNHLAFQSGECKAVCLDHMKPLVIPAGRDRFRDIGAPAVEALNQKGGGAGKESRLAQWVRLCEQRFPAQPAKAASEWSFDANKYAEVEIDALKAHKEEEQRVRSAYERHIQ